MRDRFDLTPEQYHAGLDKLWAALGVEGVQDEDVFTLSARAIEKSKILSKRTIDILSHEVSRWTLRNIDCYPRVQLWLRYVEEVYSLDYETLLEWVSGDKRFFCFGCKWIEEKLKSCRP